MADTEYTRDVRLTLDEIEFVMNELRSSFHDGSDFEPECPSCTAFQKLAAVREAAASPASKGVGGVEPTGTGGIKGIAK